MRLGVGQRRAQRRLAGDGRKQVAHLAVVARVGREGDGLRRSLAAQEEARRAEATRIATAAAGLDAWPGVLHRGLGWVGRWPGLVAVIPNDSAHDMAAEQLLRQLGAGVSADEARAAISAAALRGELRAAAYVAQPGDPSTLVGFACGVTEVIADGQVVINGTSPLQEVPLGSPEQLTVRAANLAAAELGKTCAACHATGVAGAPKLGDKSAWAPRLAGGRDGLLTAVLKGKGAMPPKGGNASLSDADAKSAVEFMLSQVR